MKKNQNINLLYRLKLSACCFCTAGDLYAKPGASHCLGKKAKHRCGQCQLRSGDCPKANMGNHGSGLAAGILIPLLLQQFGFTGDPCASHDV